jgi:hypothetical protein
MAWKDEISLIIFGMQGSDFQREYTGINGRETMAEIAYFCRK